MVAARLAACVVSLLLAQTQQSGHWRLQGDFLMGCTCRLPCPCRYQNAREHGCDEFGVMRITQGVSGNVALAGAMLVWIAGADYTIVFLDSRAGRDQRQALEEIVRSGGAGLGDHLQTVKTAPIEVRMANQGYEVKVGDALRFTARPVLGADGRNPIEIRNLGGGPTGHGPMQQWLTTEVRFKDGERAFAAREVNGYFASFAVSGAF